MVNKYDLETIVEKIREFIKSQLKVDLTSEKGYVIATVTLSGEKVSESKLLIE